MNESVAGRDLSIYDVAREAGVSFGTVSRALNSRPGVSAETKEHVLEVARNLGYVPSPIARSLAAQRALAVGVAVPDLADPFFMPVAGAIQDVAQRHGHAVIVSHTGRARADALASMQAMSRYRLAGLVVLGGSDHADDELAEVLHDVPTVVAIRRSKRFASVYFDHARGARRMVEHLVTTGRSRIAFVGLADDSVAARDRLRGFRAGLRDAGLTATAVARAGHTLEHGVIGTDQVLAADVRPDAISYATDALALAGLRRLQEAGIRVPDDIAVGGFGDIPYARVSSPSLTTIGVPHEAIGATAGSMLESLLSAPGTELDSFEFATELIAREST